MLRRKKYRGAVVFAAVCGLVGCSASAGNPSATSGVSPSSSVATETGPTSQPTLSTRTKNWVDLEPGECLGEPPPSDPSVVTVTVVDCVTPHQAEVFLRAEIPVNDAIAEKANQQCAAGLTQYAGAEASSKFAITYLVDSVQDRTENNPLPSAVICMLQSPSGQPLVGSARH